MPTNFICLRINSALCSFEHNNKILVLVKLDPCLQLKLYVFKYKYFHGLKSYNESLASRGTKYSMDRNPKLITMKPN